MATPVPGNKDSPPDPSDCASLSTLEVVAEIAALDRTDFTVHLARPRASQSAYGSVRSPTLPRSWRKRLRTLEEAVRKITDLLTG